MRYLVSVAIVLWFAASAAAQIVIPDRVDPHTPIVASLAAELPEGAQIQGGWASDTAKWIAVSPTVIHVWAAPGTHAISFRGAWVQTRSVELPNGEVIQALIGFGFLDDTATVVVGEPEPPPPPPPPPGLRLGVIVEESQERTPQQAQLWLESRQAFEANRLYILDKDQSPSDQSLSNAVQAARDSRLELPVLVVLSEGGDVVRVVSCPGSVEQLKSELSK